MGEFNYYDRPEHEDEYEDGYEYEEDFDECPMCKKSNVDEDNNPLYPEDEIFCSKECSEKYTEQQRKFDIDKKGENEN